MFPLSIAMRASDWMKISSYVRLSQTPPTTTDTLLCPICYCNIEPCDIVVQFNVCEHFVHKLCMLQYFMHRHKEDTPLTIESKPDEDKAEKTTTDKPICTLPTEPITNGEKPTNPHEPSSQVVLLSPPANDPKPLKCLKCQSYSNINILNDLSL